MSVAALCESCRRGDGDATTWYFGSFELFCRLSKSTVSVPLEIPSQQYGKNHYNWKVMSHESKIGDRKSDLKDLKYPHPRPSATQHPTSTTAT